MWRSNILHWYFEGSCCVLGIGLYIFTKEEWGGANRVLCNWDGVIAEGRGGGDNKVICHGHTHTWRVGEGGII